jgi:hypothetical protein
MKKSTKDKERMTEFDLELLDSTTLELIVRIYQQQARIKELEEQCQSLTPPQK